MRWCRMTTAVTSAYPSSPSGKLRSAGRDREASPSASIGVRGSGVSQARVQRMRRLSVCVLSVVAVIGSAGVAQATFPGRNGTIVFAARPPGELKSLRQIEPDGTGLRHLIPRGTGEDRAPAWSPDGTTLAFASGRSGNLDIW